MATACLQQMTWTALHLSHLNSVTCLYTQLPNQLLEYLYRLLSGCKDRPSCLLCMHVAYLSLY